MTLPPLDHIHTLPVVAPCEHMAGNEKFIRKALALQHTYVDSSGRSLVDVSIDLEDGAPVGSEATLRTLAVEILKSSANHFKQMGVRVHPFTSPHFIKDISDVVARASDTVAYITLSKTQSAEELLRAYETIIQYVPNCTIPIHVLIETPLAVQDVTEIASQPFVQVLDFGLMDFISHLGGAIHSDYMRSPKQFDHKIISSTKEKICFAALAHNKIPSHNVCVELSDMEQSYRDARRARDEFGFLRMWSIHPEQIPHIIKGILPDADEISAAKAILAAGEAAGWGPTKVDGRLHDRASYRYYWGALKRAGAT